MASTNQKRLARRRFLADHLDLNGASVLEIGPLESPTFTPADCDVKYLDWFTTQELQEKHRGNPKLHPERFVEVTYAVKSKRFSDTIEERFDVVIANHIIEHIPDVIGWLGELATVCTDNAAIFLSVPDRNYTFDYLRPESTVIDLLRAHDADLERPDYYQILSSIYYWRPITQGEVWSGEDLGPKLRSKRYSLREAMARAVAGMNSYRDSHCHVFSRATFGALWADLEESGLIEWTLKDIDDVKRDMNEFHAILVKH